MGERSRIGPVAYGLAFYFLVGALEALNIAAIGSFMKIMVLIPLGLMIFQVAALRLRFHSLLYLQIAFWLLAILSLFYSVGLERTLSSDITLTLNLAMVLVLGVMVPYNKAEQDLLQKALLLGCWIQIIMTLLFADVSAGGRLTVRFGESNQDQNTNNMYFMYAFSYYCYHLLSDKKRKMIIPILIMLTLVLFSGSRGALVAFAMVFFFHICIFFGKSKHAMRKILAVAVLLIVTILAIDLIMEILPESVSVRFSKEYLAEKGTSGRSRIWRYLWGVFRESNMLRMLFGHGYGTTILLNELNHLVAHNLYLDNLMTLGIVGVGLQLATQGSVLYIFYKHRKYALMGAYIGMIGMCLSLSLVASKPIWNMLLMALVLDCNANRSQSCERIQNAQ